MKTIIRNLLAAVIGVAFGGAVNMKLLAFGNLLIPPPIGADMMTTEGLNAAMPLLEPKHFIMPFLAHALGVLVGAAVAAFIAPSQKMQFALGIGIFFLIGGIAMVVLLPASPLWFSVLDIVGAYIPAAYLAGKWAQKQAFEDKYR
jgi:hypothetical protein